MKKIIALLIVSAMYFEVHAQIGQDTVAMIEKIFEIYKPNNPGCQVAISRNGQLIYSKAWGMADLEHNVALTKESVLEAGSVSKQFTAACILLLEQQGKLSVDDDVRKYVPELPDYGKTITLRHMMQHLSGLKDWGAIASIAGWPRSTKTYNNDDALFIIARQKTLNNVPGAEYLYSNSNYNLFAIIVERVSGKSLADFSKQHLFEPAGMKHTEWRNNYKKIVPNRAIAYNKNGGVYFTEMPNEYVYGNGGLLTTAEDLIAWNHYYLNGKLGNPSLLSKQLAPMKLNNGRMNTYAAGLVVDSVRGHKYIGHNGATAGYRASLDHFADLGLSIAWISNTSEFDQGPGAFNGLVNLLVKDISTRQTPPSPAAFTVSQKSLDSYTGWYFDQPNGAAVKLFIRDGKLANSRGGNMIPISENVFQVGQAKVEVITSRPKHLLFTSPTGTNYFAAVDSAIFNEKTIAEYVGEYYSEEAEVTYRVMMKDGKLIMHRSTDPYL
jgi:CubicO group peptidase (beta-lactamase class C family)